MSIALIAAGVLVAERTLLRFYNIWWVREYPLIPEPIPGRPYPVTDAVRDGLYRPLVKAPDFIPALFGRHGLWIGWNMIIVDVWQLTAATLCAYLSIRIGALCFEKSVLKENHEHAEPAARPNADRPGPLRQ